MGSAWSSLRTRSANIWQRLGNRIRARLRWKTHKVSTNTSDEYPLRETCDVAIIGGGIIGIIVALGLLHRGFKVTVYERSTKFTEAGAGLTLNGAARRAMARVSPKVLQALEQAAPGAPGQRPFMRYYDGFTPLADSPLWQIPTERLGYRGCLRSAFLDALGHGLPDGVVQFGKQLETYEDGKDGGKVTLRFTDGTVAMVDAVIGCDGIKSRTRQLLLGQNDPAAYPGFTHMVAYRGVVPIEDAVAAIGKDKGYSYCGHVGPSGCTVTYPIANDTLFNIILFCKTPEPWPDSANLLMSCQRAEAQQACKPWKRDVRAIVDLLPETLNKWAMFDMADPPATTYASGRVCIAGDAAHATTPFLASGAGMGIEDAAILASTLETALNKTGSGIDMAAAVTAAFRAYSASRLQRSQRVVCDSRAVADICMWQNPETGRDAERCFAEFWACIQRVVEFDIGDAIHKAQQDCLRLLDETTSVDSSSFKSK